MMNFNTLNQSQVILLQSFASLERKSDADELEELLKSFYAKKLDEEMERLWENGTFNQETLDDLRNQHPRFLCLPL